MRFLTSLALVLINLVQCTPTYAATPVVGYPSGNSIKLLKPNLDLNGAVSVLSGTVDPTATATLAPKGSLYLNTSTGMTYRKLDAGSTVNWTQISIGSVTQANFFGAVTWPGASNCNWSSTSATWANFPVDADCTIPSGGGVEGSAVAPATKLPSISFNSMPAGKYFFVATTDAGGTGTAPVCRYRFSDGTNSTSPVGFYNAAGAGSLGVLNGDLTYTTAQGATTFNIQTTKQAGNECNIYAYGVDNPLKISVYYFPTQGQTVTPNTLDVLGQVFYTAASTCPAGSEAADGGTTTNAQLIARLGSATRPDMRGLFVRGTGTNATTLNGKTVSGGALGTLAGDATAKNGLYDSGHVHTNLSNNAGQGGGSTGYTGSSNNAFGTFNSGTGYASILSSDTETRPANISLTACISTSTTPAPYVLSTVPTVQRFLTGSGTYTPTSGQVKYITAELVGPGGGGSGGSTATTTAGSGTTGSATTFGTLSAGPGVGGTGSGSAGTGGVATVGAGFTDAGSTDGADGESGNVYVDGNYATGANGGASFFGGAGNGGYVTAAGGNAKTNSGSGGGGGSCGTAPSANTRGGSGGGAGAYVKATAPAGSFAYSVGSGGSGGAGAGSGSAAGGNGAAGKIIVTEYY